MKCEELDEALLSKHLQLRGTISASVWRFAMPNRLSERPISRHVQHWANLFQKYAEGRRALQKLGYRFSIHFWAENGFPIAFTVDEIDFIARVRCGVVIENYDAP